MPPPTREEEQERVDERRREVRAEIEECLEELRRSAELLRHYIAAMEALLESPQLQ